MRAPILVLIIAALLPQGVPAGPWPRAAGEGFAAFSLVADPQGARAESYLEFGVTPALTLGADLAQKRTDLDAELFARWHLHSFAGEHPLSVSAGVLTGYDAIAGRVERGRAKLAVHAGYGFASPGDGGWAKLSVATIQARGAGAPEFDVFAEAGIRPGDWGHLRMGLGAYRGGGDTWVSLAPGFGLRLGDFGTLVAEATIDTSHGTPTEFTLGLWRRF